ncbi:MAG TPA: HAD family hydrolase [Chromatiaceae bacterium]|nr:HAD family hydrolase [Chromatiaceae bacterium]
MVLKALIFDVDGTLAETEEIHRKAFNRSFSDAGLNWHWSRERYRELLSTSGGKERILRHIEEKYPELLERDDLQEWIAELHKSKTNHYKAMMAAGEVELRPGIERLIREAREEGLKLSIATTTSPANITALFEATLGPESLEWFEVIGDAEKAPVKKPDPSVYLHVL